MFDVVSGWVYGKDFNVKSISDKSRVLDISKCRRRWISVVQINIDIWVVC